MSLHVLNQEKTAQSPVSPVSSNNTKSIPEVNRKGDKIHTPDPQPLTETSEKSRDNDPIQEIIAWVAEKYDDRNPMEEIILHPRDIPSEMRRQAALDDKSLQYLISQTLTRCNRTRKR